jgi:hypothetical protein
VTDVSLVLDTSAVLAYGRDAPEVGARISDAADQGRLVLVPALCLAEAYRRTDNEGWHLLDVLASLPNVTVPGISHGDCQHLGGFARTLGSKHLAHVVLEASTYPIVPILTSERARITKILADEWPIIDL